MASFDLINAVPEQGTTFMIGSWVYVANGLGGYDSHLANPKEQEVVSTKQSRLVDDPVDNISETLLCDPIKETKGSTFDATSSPLTPPILGEQGATACLEAPIFDNYSDSGVFIPDLPPQQGKSITETHREESIKQSPTHAIGANKFQFSDILGNYVNELKLIPPYTVNNELLGRVDHVSRNIAECIELAKSALQHHKDKTHKNLRSLAHDLTRHLLRD